MSNYKDYKKKVLQNPEIKSEYDALQPEYDTACWHLQNSFS